MIPLHLSMNLVGPNSPTSLSVLSYDAVERAIKADGLIFVNYARALLHSVKMYESTRQVNEAMAS